MVTDDLKSVEAYLTALMLRQVPGSGLSQDLGNAVRMLGPCIRDVEALERQSVPRQARGTIDGERVVALPARQTSTSAPGDDAA